MISNIQIVRDNEHIEFYTPGYKHCIKVLSVLRWIQIKKLNFDEFYTHNNSPLCDGNPEFDVYEERPYCSEMAYLTDNLKEVVQEYHTENLT